MVFFLFSKSISYTSETSLSSLNPYIINKIEFPRKIKDYATQPPDPKLTREINKVYLVEQRIKWGSPQEKSSQKTESLLKGYSSHHISGQILSFSPSPTSIYWILPLRSVWFVLQVVPWILNSRSFTIPTFGGILERNPRVHQKQNSLIHSHIQWGKAMRIPGKPFPIF